VQRWIAKVAKGRGSKEDRILTMRTLRAAGFWASAEMEMEHAQSGLGAYVRINRNLVSTNVQE